jgi:hypothetical protein
VRLEIENVPCREGWNLSQHRVRLSEGGRREDVFSGETEVTINAC